MVGMLALICRPERKDATSPKTTLMTMRGVSHAGTDFMLHPVVKKTPKKSASARRNASMVIFMCIITLQSFFTT
ncbi:hypothetical protein DSLPV1_007 [Dishui lake phycodnavirus 1]|uniref:hypothetical protein n=1 Tax=Dishui lake phycodnavirus 1 TaxID=2079134 RepID=UPI000CD6B89A|nr:hypothetical protein C5Y57_gp007 [Dishui lake phycodnavirus 1]AUT18978.1 hypothetical protein DSLPV1_007 [Dishui lake phycodnavirus 1]